MATYAELLTLATTASGNALQDRIRVAAVVACDLIRLEAVDTPNHASRLAWAVATLRDPGASARVLLWAVLAQNRTFTSAQIASADDATVQTAVNAAVNLVAQE